MIDRKQWGAARITSGLPLNHPIPHVIITHVGVQENPCENLFTCSIKMRTFQDAAIAEQKIIDIPANFYVSFCLVCVILVKYCIYLKKVSKDGHIYEGRGWKYQNNYSNRSLALAFLGDYIRYEPSSEQLEGATFLLEYGVTKNYLDKDYLLLAHNQVGILKGCLDCLYFDINLDAFILLLDNKNGQPRQ